MIYLQKPNWAITDFGMAQTPRFREALHRAASFPTPNPLLFLSISCPKPPGAQWRTGMRQARASAARRGGGKDLPQDLQFG